MCRVLGSSWEAQFLAPGHQSMDVWHLLFCHWNGAMKRTCIIHPLHLVRGWWCRIELVSSGVGIEQGWELGQPISESCKRRLGRTYHGCGPGCPSMSAHLKKTPHKHLLWQLKRATCESAWSPLAQLWEGYVSLRTVRNVLLGSWGWANRATFGTVWNMVTCAFTSLSLGHFSLSTLGAESWIYRLW